MLSKELELSLNAAFKEARDRRHEFITVEHLLLALLKNNSVMNVLNSCGADLNILKQDLSYFLEETTPVLTDTDDRDTQPTLGFQRVLQRAVFHVQSSGKAEVTGANVLVAIYSEQDSQSVYLLKQQDIGRLDVVNFLSHGMSRSGEEGADDFEQTTGTESANENGKTALDTYATNLNEQAKQGKIDPLVGRKDEIERAIQVLCRRRKNNPLFVGEAGVGKTALAEGLARMIVDGSVPEVLLDSTVTRWTWVLYWPAPNTVVILRNA